ncbi:MAG TPA: GNAT family N-acetyltransferase [Proteiniclasticum sp.]|nr:GNAT family N-acetyltransferase [Proteiniclasticum sp.]
MDDRASIVRLTEHDFIGANRVFEVTIRDAFDKQGLADLEEDISEEISFKAMMMRDSLDHKGDTFFYLARIKDQVIGTISYGPSGEIIKECTENELENVGELGSLYVLPEFQNQGIGSLLINSLIRELYGNGIERFCLDSGYKRAQKRWLHKFGEPYMIVKDYWGEGSDHMIWLCSVSDFMIE